MTKTTVLIKNLTRNKLRTTLTVLAIAMPMFVFTIARSFVDVVDRFLEQSDREMRVAVHQKLSYTAQLPQKMRDEIMNLAPEGYISAICRTSWFGGRIEGKPASFPSMGVDRDTFARVYSEFKLTPAEVEAFQSQRQGAIVGTQLANQQNWKVGDRVTLRGAIPPNPLMEFIIAAIPAELDAPWFYFGLDYYDESVKALGLDGVGVNNFWLKCSTPEARRWALSEIDKHYTNSEYETRTEMESTFIAQFAKSGGDWVGMTWNIGKLIVLVAVAVAFNTMSMAFRERTREIAVLRTLGFPAGRIVRMLLAEGALLGLFGGVLAVGPVYLLTQSFDIVLPSVGFPVRILDETALLALGIALACGLLAALVPAILAGRLKVAGALRQVV